MGVSVKVETGWNAVWAEVQPPPLLVLLLLLLLLLPTPSLLLPLLHTLDMFHTLGLPGAH